MLETIDLKRKVDKQTYQEWLPRLKTDLRELQQQAREHGLGVLVIFEGWDTAGKGDSIRHLCEVLDPRGFGVHVTSGPTEEERRRHWLWRFWTRVPHRGAFAFCERFWYYRVLEGRFSGELSAEQWSHAYQEINQTEEMLAEDNTLVVKYWLHISKKEQRRRLEKEEGDPLSRYTITKREWKRHDRYDDYLAIAEEMLERTSTHHAPWHIVAANDPRHCRMKILQHLCEEIVNALNRMKHRSQAGAIKTDKISVPVLEEMPTLLDKVDLGQTLTEEVYQAKKVESQIRIRDLQVKAIKKGVPCMVVFQGWDAAGKGGAIRRMTAPLDPRFYQVVAISKPSHEELAYHYLWRFWKHVPPKGHMAIFDRSHYGRVLVERIEGFCTEAEWRRAYREINEFEHHLYTSGMVIVKIFLHITKDEQLARFEARRQTPHKRWKMNDEDWRNREKWDHYRDCVDDMVQRTSTTYAPWTIVEGNCKLHARVKVINTVADALAKGLAAAK